MGGVEERYTAEHIKVLEDLEAVRKRPSMYIGSTGKRGLHHLINEVVDNSIDEATAGYCDRISVVIKKDGFVEITDNGRGIPVDVHEKYKKPALEVVLTKLHAGGKFDHKVYKVSGGLHGVGISVVNALSEKLIAVVKRGGKVYKQEFERGKPTAPMVESNEGFEFESGTKIIFKPDKEIFENTDFDYEYVEARLRELSFLNPGVKISLLDERTSKKSEFLSKNGLMDFMEFLCSGKERLTRNMLYVKREVEGTLVEIAMHYTKSFKEDIISFANNINTIEGGSHVVGFKRGISRAVMKYINDNNLSKNVKITGEDIREGMVSIINVKLANPQFEGQTKTKLGNENIKGIVESITYENVKTYLHENPDDARRIAERVLSSARAREAAKKARELVRRKSFLESTTLPGKLTDCSERDVEKTELFIVEGESAGGSAKQARDKRYQAVLPLRGKILNVEKAGMVNMLKNKEIQAIISAIGTGIGENFDIKKCRYGKIIIMTDADVDGSHIKTLLLTFFYRHMLPLIEEGRVFIAKPPLYRIRAGRVEKYSYTEEEKEKILKELGGNATVQRYKGLGEMNPEQLRKTTMEKENRVIINVSVGDAAEADRMFSVLMGSNTELRRKFIVEHALEVKNLDI